MWWSDGYMPIGPRFLRTMWGVGDELWNVSDSTAVPGTTIVYFDFGNINAVPYCIVFLSDGSLYAINTDTGVATRIAGPGTIQSPAPNSVDMTQWGNQYFIIVSLGQVNGYFIWDGATFFVAGDVFAGGTVPTGLHGNAVEIYAGRVWVAKQQTVFFSAPGSLVDYSGADGAGDFTSSDSFLRISYIALRQSNGFLYLVGDSSLNYISGVQTSGSPAVTTFTNQNADPEVGTPWPGTVTTFGRNIIFANAFGVHVSYGAAVTKISEPLDGVYNTVADFGGFVPSAAKAIVFGKKIWLLLLPIIDPISGQQVNKLFGWNGKLWFAASQDMDLIFVQSQEILSVLTAWGTDGQSIRPLFQTPSSALNKVTQSRLWDTPVGIEQTKSVQRLWGIVQLFTNTNTAVTVKIDNEHNVANQASYTPNYLATGVMTWTGLAGAALTWTGLAGAVLTWRSAGVGLVPFEPTAVSQNGILTGFTVQTSCPDLALVILKMAPEAIDYRG